MVQEFASEYFSKAEESLAGAQSEFINARYNNCANRCYYACFQAAIAALIRAGIVPLGPIKNWGHDFVQAQFIGQLVNRRKVYPSSVRNTLEQNYRLRVAADYREDAVSKVRVSRAVSRTEAFLDATRPGRRAAS